MAALFARRIGGRPWRAGSLPAAHSFQLSPRWLSTTAAELDGLLARVGADNDNNAAAALHVIRSTGRNPYANLALEHRLFQRAHPDARLLLLYRNAPCVVLGRNQNPWVEVDLNKLRGSQTRLVRRRSGGGAVYHDAGNANWSVHVPAAAFDRDQHAHMVARALRQRLGVAGARVNERHDIVIQGDNGDFKISGSAYKLTRRRALHHGTCLLGADLAAVAGLLRAPPAAPYIKARGVASVRSPVQNVVLEGSNNGDDNDTEKDPFGDAVAAEFEQLYGATASHTTVNVDALAAERNPFASVNDTPLADGYAELQTADWLFGQTPQFGFSTRPTADDPRARPVRPDGVPAAFALEFTARHGVLCDVVVEGFAIKGDNTTVTVDKTVAAALEGRVLYEIQDWRAVLADASPAETHAEAVGAWLNELLGVGSSQKQ